MIFFEQGISGVSEVFLGGKMQSRQVETRANGSRVRKEHRLLWQGRGLSGCCSPFLFDPAGARVEVAVRSVGMARAASTLIMPPHACASLKASAEVCDGHRNLSE